MRLTALAIAAASIAAIGWAIARPHDSDGLMFIGAFLPGAVAVWVWSELDERPAMRAVIGGTIIGIAVAVAGHGIVLAFSYAFLLGFAEAATDFLDAVSIDPRLTEIISSPWTILILVELAVVAPLTEEFGKGLGGRWQRPQTRTAAFAAGAAAGAGFAVAENILYASGALWFGEPWTAILLGRALGATVHVLASGLVVLGWWEWRETGETRHAWRGYLSGVGVHALWNGSLVVLLIADEAYRLSDLTIGFPAVAVTYSAVIGAITAAALWAVTRSIRDGTDIRFGIRFQEARGLAGWIVIAASLLIPVAMLVLTWPTVYGG